MSTVNKNALVPYTPAEMYALVNDIDAYDQFLPWCSGSTVMSDDGEVMEAQVDLALGGIRKSFVTRNRLQRNKMIEMRLVEGPFRRLEGFWRFDPLGDVGCKVALDLEFDFSSKLLGAVFGRAFKEVANTLVDAFCKRATEIYGKR